MPKTHEKTPRFFGHVHDGPLGERRKGKESAELLFLSGMDHFSRGSERDVASVHVSRREEDVDDSFIEFSPKREKRLAPNGLQTMDMRSGPALLMTAQSPPLEEMELGQVGRFEEPASTGRGAKRYAQSSTRVEVEGLSLDRAGGLRPFSGHKIQEFGTGHFAKMKQGEQRKVGSLENSEEKMYLYEGAAEREEQQEKLEVLVRRPAEKCYCKPHWE